jgi:hypothetical protein
VSVKGMVWWYNSACKKQIDKCTLSNYSLINEEIKAFERLCHQFFASKFKEDFPRVYGF